MTLLKNGVDTSVIALWLGHEGTETTQVYLNSRELHQPGEKLQVSSSLDFRVFRGLSGPDDQSLRKKTGRHLGPGTTKPSRQHASYDAAPR